MGLLNMREFDTKRFNWEIIFLYKKEIYIFEVFMIFNILRLKYNVRVEIKIPNVTCTCSEININKKLLLTNIQRKSDF